MLVRCEWVCQTGACCCAPRDMDVTGFRVRRLDGAGPELRVNPGAETEVIDREVYLAAPNGNSQTK